MTHSIEDRLLSLIKDSIGFFYYKNESKGRFFGRPEVDKTLVLILLYYKHMLFRYFLVPSGRMSLKRYRLFFLAYFFILLPFLVLVFFGLLSLGSKSNSGVVHQVSGGSVYVASLFYFAACLWPIFVATHRRMNDLGIKFREYFFVISPLKTLKLGRALFFKEGEEFTNLHGSNPGRYE